MPAVPFIVQGGLAAGSAIAGHYASKSAAAGAMNRSPEEQAALARQSQAATQSAQFGNQFSSLALPRVGQALNYYGTLLGGNRAAIRGAVAPETQDINEAYRGADTSLGRTYIQGGQREQALAENARAKAGQISRLIGGVRPMAAQGLSQLGLGAAQAGQQQQYIGGLLNQGLLQQGFQNRLLGQQAGANAAGQWGGLFARLSSALGPLGQKNAGTGGTTSGKGPAIPSYFFNPSTPTAEGQGDFYQPTGAWG
ncbi:MAG: hypothetical protein DMF56_27170 [Acidobacteria bacterium]|nr:MAG: hypothetical protein DMF56_27170 [Acidobacteriota bacterium]